MALKGAGSLRDTVWRTAQAIGLEKAEATLDALNRGPAGPAEYLPEHLELIGAWVEAVDLLRREDDQGPRPPAPRPSRRLDGGW